VSGLARRQLTLDNTVAAELAGSEDTVLRELRGRLDCDLHLRGNVLTLDGDPVDVEAGAIVVDELVELIEGGHDVAPGTPTRARPRSSTTSSGDTATPRWRRKR